MTTETTETMNTGDVCRRIGLIVTAEMLLELGFEPVAVEKRSKLWAQSDYPAMCNAVGNWIKSRAGVPMQPKPEKKAKAPEATPARGLVVPPPVVHDDDEEL